MNRTLLVIDDDRHVARMTQRTARVLGLDAHAVLDPLQATQAFVDLRPDVVLLDMAMPEKDGIDVLDEIILSGIPTRLVLMGSAGDAYLRLAQGVARFHGISALPELHKPFQRHEVALLLNRILR